MSYRVRMNLQPYWFTYATFDETPEGYGLFQAARPVPPEIMPTSGFLDKPKKRLPDFISVFGTWIVTATFRDLVETLEPGRHQFFPFTLRSKKRNGEIVEKFKFLFNEVNRVEALVPEESDLTWESIPSGGKILRYTKRPDPVLAMRKTLIAGKHIWRDPRKMSEMFFSSELGDAVQAAGLKGLEFLKIRDI